MNKKATLNPIANNLMFICRDDCNSCTGVTANEHLSVALARHYMYNTRGLEKNSIGLDLGAHQGLYGASLYTQVKRMHSFEPNKESYDALALNQIRYENIIPYQVAAWDQETTFEKTWNDNNCPNDSKNTPAVVLDDYEPIAREKFNFIKMDIEGCEVPALRGMKNILERTKNCLLISEFCLIHFDKAKTTPQEFFDIIESNGFNLIMNKKEELYKLGKETVINLHFIKGE